MLTCASEGVPEADGEPEPVLHGAPPHHLLWVVVTETEHLIGWSIRLVRDLANACKMALEKAANYVRRCSIKFVGDTKLNMPMHALLMS